jgi:hypothetical protein
MTFWYPSELVKAGQTLAASVQTLRDDLAGERAARAFAMQRLTEEQRAHAAVVEEYRRRLAIAQANFEWLSIAYNRIEAERSQLLLGRIGIVSPPITVDTAVGQGVPIGSPVLGPQPQRRRDVPDEQTIAEMVASGSLFEDAGDPGATVLGLNDPLSKFDADPFLQ